MTTTAPHHPLGRAITFVYLMRPDASHWHAVATATYSADAVTCLAAAARVFADAGFRGGRTEYLQVVQRQHNYLGPVDQCRSILVVDDAVNSDA